MCTHLPVSTLLLLVRMQMCMHSFARTCPPLHRRHRLPHPCNLLLRGLHLAPQSKQVVLVVPVGVCGESTGMGFNRVCTLSVPVNHTSVVGE